MFGVKQHFFPGDVLALTPQVPLKTGGTEDWKRMHMFVPWINHDGEEFRIDVRLENDNALGGSRDLFHADTAGDDATGFPHKDAWDSREDNDGDWVVDGNWEGTSLNVTDHYETPWNLIEASDSTDGEEQKRFILLEQPPGTTDAFVEVKLAVGLEACVYYHGMKVNGVFMEGIDTLNAYQLANQIRGELRGSPRLSIDSRRLALTSLLGGPVGTVFGGGVSIVRPEISGEDHWDLNTDDMSPGAATQYIARVDNISVNVDHDPNHQSHMTLWYESEYYGSPVQVTANELFIDPISGGVDDLSQSSGFLYESPERSGSENTFILNLSTNQGVTKIWLEDVRGPIAYQIKYKKVDLKPEDSDGIPVKDFLLYTTSSYTQELKHGSHSTSTKDDLWENSWRLYIIFREEINLTLLAHMRSKDRPLWPIKLQNTLPREQRDIGGADPLLGDDEYYRSNYLMVADQTQMGYYGAIVHQPNPNKLWWENKASWEPLGYEIQSVLQFSDSGLRWDQITDPGNQPFGEEGNRPYKRTTGFVPVVFTGLYAAEILIPEGEITRSVRVELLGNRKYDSKLDWINTIGNALQELLARGVTFVSDWTPGSIINLLVKWVLNPILEKIQWLTRQISNFFGKILTVIMDFVDRIGTILELVAIIIVLGGFAYIILLFNRFMQGLRNLTSRTRTQVEEAGKRTAGGQQI
jgi:hypothetical protein